MDAEGRLKNAPAFSTFTTSMWLGNAGAVAERVGGRRIQKPKFEVQVQLPAVLTL